MKVEEASRLAIQTLLDYCKESRWFTVENQFSNVLSQITYKGSQIAAVIQHLKYQEVYVDKTHEYITIIVESIDAVS